MGDRRSGILFEGVVGLSGGGGFFAEPFVAGLVVTGPLALISGIVDRGRGEA